MLSRFIKTVALAIPVLAVCGCANLNRPATYGLDPAGAALVRQTCTDVMGLSSGLAEFDACAFTLADSARSLQDAHLIAQAHIGCKEQGFAPGSAELATCVVVAKRAEARPVAAGYAPLNVSAVPTRTYFSKTRSQQEESVELSCAQLGLHPAWPSFKQCVVSMKEAIISAQQPPL